MSPDGGIKVAVLLATYNGEEFVDAQIQSLKENSTPFVLHWLDDHSRDNSREVVRAAAQGAKIEIKEWHGPARHGVPSAYFELLERVEADVYLFCDQDDIWQPGKLDATVLDLLPDLSDPILSFSDFYAFDNDAPHIVKRLSEISGVTNITALNRPSMFAVCPAWGHTIGLTRPLRDMFLLTKDIAGRYAASHDWWMHLLAKASGTARLLVDVPTTLYRVHGNNTVGLQINEDLLKWRNIRKFWERSRALRRWGSRQAQGFELVSDRLPPTSELENMLSLSKQFKSIHRRQSVASVLSMLNKGMLPPSRTRALFYAVSCMLVNAGEK